MKRFLTLAAGILAVGLTVLPEDASAQWRGGWRGGGFGHRGALGGGYRGHWGGGWRGAAWRGPAGGWRGGWGGGYRHYGRGWGGGALAAGALIGAAAYS
jgi:hypothetical protein